MAAVPMKKEFKPPKWDKPLAVIIALVFLAIVVLFIMNYAGPTTIAAP